MSKETVFITGATGFIGSHTVNYALKAGYRVKLSIRRKEQEQDIKSWLEGSFEHVEFYHVPDLTKKGAFVKALSGVDYIFHLASPLPGKGEDVKKDYVQPAVDGTLAILKEALKHERVKFVIITSSILALIPMGGIARPPVQPRANTGERLKVNLEREFPTGFAGHGMKYSASKILAHQATRDFIASEQPPFKIISFHPVFVIGDSLIQRSFQQIDGMNARLWTSLSQPEPLIPSAFVHVRDCGEAHVKALQRREVLKTGAEYILSEKVFGWDNVTSCVQKNFPQVEVALKPGKKPQDDWVVDASPAERDFGMLWRSGDEMVKGVLQQQLRLKGKANL